MSAEHPSRRQFLTATGALATLAWTGAEAVACRRRRQCYSVASPCPPGPWLRVRQDIAALGEEQLDALRRGVAVMKARPASDPRSWRFQANIHGTLDPTTNPLFNQCEHGTLLFLAWHRAYLYYFERILSQAANDPNLTLPYWDWTTAPALPVTYRAPASAGNPLYDGTRAINDGSALPPQVVVADLNTALNYIPFPPSGFVGFSRSLEGSPHGAVHVLVGGNMGSVPTAANDPIFWLHHGNIDRIWDRWLNLAGGRVNPSDAAFLDKTYSLPDENGDSLTFKVRDILSSARLGYRYDNVPNPFPTGALAMGMPAAAAAAPQPVRAASSVKADQAPPAESKPLGLKPETVKLHLAPQHSAALKTATEAVRTTRPGKLLLEIEGLSVSEVPNFSYAVYLNLPEGDVTADRTKLHYVGTINFFGKDHAGKAGHGDGGKPFTETFDVTAVVARLQGAGAWQPDALSVTLRPLTPIAPAGGEERLRKRSEESALRAKIRYQRIDLVVAR